MESATFNGASGLRNTTYVERLTKTDLVTAINVDLDESGTILRRKGITQVNGLPTHSLYSLGEQMLCVQDGAMTLMESDGVSTTLRTGIQGSRVSYATLASITYWVDGYEAGVIDTGVCRQWGVQPPPAAAATLATGSLPAGRYAVAATYLRNDGHKSGAPASTVFVVPANGALYVDLPASDNPDVVSTRVYVTTPDGDELYLYGEYPLDAAIAVLDEVVEQVVPLRTQFMGPPPAGHICAFFAGRMYVAKDNFLFYSLPYEHELFDLRTGFIPFEDRLTMVAPVTNGVFVSPTSYVMFLQGMNPDEFKTSKVYGFGAIEGTSLIVKADYIVKDAQPDPCAVWLGTDGICVGLAVGQSSNLTGQVKNLTAEKYVMRLDDITGASVLKLRDGTPHFVVSSQ